MNLVDNVPSGQRSISWKDVLALINVNSTSAGEMAMTLEISPLCKEVKFSVQYLM